ncbi:MAG: hypothetical protein AAF845_15790 [Bacteroidota bacterium]
MTHRIEPVETFASMFRWAATYSLLLTDDALYVVRVGPAMGGTGGAEGYLTGVQAALDAEHERDERQSTDDTARELGAGLGVAMAAPVLQRVEASYGAQVAQGLARLAETGHEAMVSEKGSFRLGPADVTSFTAGRKGANETMDLKTSARDFQFKVLPAGADDLRAFAEAVEAWR